MTNAWDDAVKRAARATEEPGLIPIKRPVRQGGRPPGGYATDINWGLGERLYIYGEPVEGEEGGTRWFSLRDIAARIGCSAQAVHDRSKRFKWVERHENHRKERDAAESQPPRNPAKTPTRSSEAILDSYLALWEEAVDAGKVRVDSIPDFREAVKLKTMLERERAATTERAGVLTLTDLQGRHRATLATEAAIDDAVAGVLAHGEEGIEEPEEGHEAPPPPVRATPPPSAATDDEAADEVAATVAKRQRAPRRPPLSGGRSAGRPAPKPGK